MSIEIVPLTREILEQMGKADHYDKITAAKQRSMAMLVDGKPVAAAGFILAFESTAYAWTLILPEAKDSALIMRRIHFAISTVFPQWCEQLELERVQADTPVDMPGGCAWLKRLGFSFEGIMWKYYDGKDFARHAWVRQ